MHSPSTTPALGFFRPGRTLLVRASFVSLVLAALAPSLHAAASAPQWAATPATPGDSTMLLDWNSASGAASYKVRYRTSDTTEAWTTISGLPLTPTSYTVPSLSNQKSYEFQVGATASGTTTWNTDWHARPRGSLHTSGLPAGGQVNGITRAAAGFMVAATDVGGFQRSIDGGTTWRQSSAGTYIDNGTHVCASVVYHAGSGTLYGLSGGGGQGHFWSSTDNGQTWTHQAVSANLYVDAVGSDYPRDVGKLIAVDPANANIIYVGTFNKGVQKSTNGGTSWSTLVLNGSQINGVAFDSGFLYIAAANDAVYRCTPSGGSLTKFTGSAKPSNPEELLVLGGKLYAAANTGGVRRLNNASTANASAAWTNLNVGSPTALWCAIDGYISGSNHVIVVGNSEAEQNGSRYTTVMKCTNAQASSGFTWVNISSAGGITVNNTMAAGNGETYWRTDATKGVGYGNSWGPDKKLDGANFNIDQIVIDPDDTNKIHVVGQMGIWRTLDGGTTWNPAVIGLSNAVLNTVTVDPNNPGRVYVGDSDHFLWVIDDYAESMNYVTEPPAIGGKPICIALDVDANGLIYAGLEGPAGSLWTFNRSSQTWTELADNSGATLRSIANTSGKTVHGVRVQHISGSRVVLAAVDNSGIWRLAAGGNWTKVQSTTLAGLGSSIKTMPFVWPTSNQQLVFFFDAGTGVWRSTNAGQSWTNIWSTGFSSQFAGCIAMRTSTSQLFVTTNNTLYRLENADTASNPSATNLNIANAGKLAAFGNTLWVACYADGPGGTDTDQVKLHRSTDGTNFTAFTTNYYQGAMIRVTGLAADATRQYITGGPMGITVSEN